MTKNLLDPAVILQILADVNGAESIGRRRDTFNAYQIYKGNLDPYVEAELSRTRAKSYKNYTYSDISLSALITDKRAQAYDEEPIRNIDGNDKKIESLSDIYEEGDADAQLEFFDSLYNLNRYALMWVNYSEVKKRHQFMTLQPYEAVIVRDKDDGELQIVGLNYPNSTITQDSRSGDGTPNLIAESQADSGSEQETWVFWSADQHVKVQYSSDKILNSSGGYDVKKSIDYVEIEGNPNNVNPLKELPFVFKSSDVSPDYPVTNPLTKQTIKFNTQQSETMTSKNIHGTGIQVFSYPESQQGDFDEMEFGVLTAVELPQKEDEGSPETTFDYKTSGAQLIPMREVDKGYVEQVARQHGLDNFEIDKGSVTAMNGISRAIAGASVQKIITKNQKCYAKVERDIFKILKAWDKFNSAGKFSDEDELQVVFPKPKVLISDSEALDNIEKALRLGVIEEWEKLIKIDPNLTEKQAKEKLARIDKSKADRAKKNIDSLLTPKEDIDEDEDGDNNGGINKKPDAES